MTDFFNVQFLLVTALVSAVIFVNGWTDAPNCVATCIGSGALGARRAINMAAVFNLLGTVVMFAVNDSVSKNIQSSIAFGESHPLTALCSSMIAIVIFAVAAYALGIPTSEGHALLAALAGSAAATGDGEANYRFFATAALGIFITTAAGFLLGLVIDKILRRLLVCSQKRFLRIAQIVAAALLAFIHGAHDGQKFAAVLLLSIALTGGQGDFSLAAALYSGILISLGTAMGGMRIIKKVGFEITKVDGCGGISCDLSAFICLFVCTLLGLPVSTTHTKTTAVLGVGCGRGIVNLSAYGGIAAAWVITFPACFAISFLVTKICI